MIELIKFKKVDTPKFTEAKGSGWVKYGLKDDYPDYLIDMFNKSTTNNAIITSKAFFISGNGVGYPNDLSVLETARAQSIIKRCNPYESLDKVVQKCTLDWEVIGAFAMEVIWKADGTFDLYHLPVDKIRMNNDATKYAYSPDWKKYKQLDDRSEEMGFKVFDVFDPENPTGSQIYYYSHYRTGREFYQLPEYVACMPYIEIDYRIGEYHLNNLTNGFMAGTLLLLSGQAPEDPEKYAKEIRKKFQGSAAEEAGGVVLMWNEEGAQQSQITNLQTNGFDKQFEQLAKDTKSNIFTGHKITSPALLGVETDSAFGNRTEIIEKMEVFQSTYVDPKQGVIEGVLFNLYAIDFELERVKPIQERLSEAVLASVATRDELREMAGLERLDTAQSFSKAKTNEEDKILELLSKAGRDADSVKVYFSRDLDYGDEGVLIDEHNFKRMAFEITDFDRQVLDAIKSGNTSNAEDIAEALNARPEEVRQSITKLLNDNLISRGEIEGIEGIEDTLEPTEEGKEIPTEFQVVYKYVPRAGLAPIIEGTRDFCRNLIRFNKVYTREEIDQISAIVGRDVWSFRGGYWNDNGTIRPACRHIWQSQLISV